MSKGDPLVEKLGFQTGRDNVGGQGVAPAGCRQRRCRADRHNEPAGSGKAGGRHRAQLVSHSCYVGP